VPETILVVDDDPDIARFVEVNLRSAGYEVAVAGDGEEALDKAAELRPDLVLLDVMMPRIDGFEVAQRLRRSPQTANTSIIMLTAKALSSDKVLGLSSGAPKLNSWVPRATLTWNSGATSVLLEPGKSGSSWAPAPTRTLMSLASCADAAVHAGTTAARARRKIFIPA